MRRTTSSVVVGSGKGKTSFKIYSLHYTDCNKLYIQKIVFFIFLSLCDTQFFIVVETTGEAPK